MPRDPASLVRVPVVGEILAWFVRPKEAVGAAYEAAPYFAKAHALLSEDSWLVENEPERIERLRALGAHATE